MLDGWNFYPSLHSTLKHIKGRENVIADTLSRIPIPEPISNNSTICNMIVSYGLPNIDDTL